jgi:hypothetical protein
VNFGYVVDYVELRPSLVWNHFILLSLASAVFSIFFLDIKTDLFAVDSRRHTQTNISHRARRAAEFFLSEFLSPEFRQIRCPAEAGD